MRWLCIALVRFYQRCISPLKSRPTCRFEPTCSSYAIEAFRKRGFFVGLWLTVSRIARCNPFCPGGYDPVPEHGLGSRRSKKATDNDKQKADEPKLICEDYVLRRERKTNTRSHTTDE